MTDTLNLLRDELTKQSEKPFHIFNPAKNLFYITENDGDNSAKARIGIGFNTTGADKTSYPRYIANALSEYEKEEAA